MFSYRPPKSSFWGHTIESQEKLAAFFDAYFDRVEYDQPGTRVMTWKTSVLPNTDWPEEFLKPEGQGWQQLLFIVTGDRLSFPLGMVFPISPQEPASYEFLRRFSQAAPFKMSPKHFQVGVLGKTSLLAWRRPNRDVAARLQEVLVRRSPAQTAASSLQVKRKTLAPPGREISEKKPNRGNPDEMMAGTAEGPKAFTQQLQDMEEKAARLALVRDKENVPQDVLNEGLRLCHLTWDDWDGYVKAVSVAQEYMKKKLKDPANVRALGLVKEAEELFWKKQYDECFQKISEAAALDPDYVPRVEDCRKAIEIEKRKGPVSLTRAINRILFPRLRKLGFRQAYGDDSPEWNELHSQLVRINSHGREGHMDMCRSRWGRTLDLSVSRIGSDGEYQGLDLSTVGLEPESLRYLNQKEADAMLKRVAAAFEGPILDWLEEVE
jgi:hypothetical protein